MAPPPERIILASASAARAMLLRAAGVDFAIEPAGIDEARLKIASRRVGDSALGCATALAVQKASEVSRRFADALVIGADQVLALGAEWFDKPPNLDEAAAQLRKLRGKSHHLATAVCVARAGMSLWCAGSEPELTMRDFSDAFLADYIEREGEVLLGCVGAYRVEGRGVQLFSRISGDYFAVLGLPLIELLGFLRDRGTVLT